MKWVLTLLLLLTSSTVLGIEKDYIIEQQISPVASDKLNADAEAALVFLSNIGEEDRKYIKFFSYYNLPDNVEFKVTSWEREKKQTISLKETVKRQLDFAIHTQTYEDLVIPTQPTGFSPTLEWIDIRNYGWTNEAWEKVSSQDPFFREPWLNYNTSVALLGLSETNPIVRADWFIIYTLDPTKQADKGEAPLHYTLTYSQVGEPKNVEDFRNAWFVDTDKIEKQLKTIKNTVVRAGHSGVTNHQNRQLAIARTELGFYSETSDVKDSTGNKNFTENITPGVFARKERDATEVITNNKIGLQVYFLGDAKGNRVEFADPTVASNRNESIDVRVKTGRSCIDCHQAGLNEAENSIARSINRGHKLKTFDEDFRRSVQRHFLSVDFNLYVHQASEIYKDAVFAVNGLTPQANAELLKKLYKWYEQDLYLEQAARECGVSVEVFKDYVSDTTSNNLGGLFDEEESGITRDDWDALKFGGFAQSMLLIKRDTLVETKTAVEAKVIFPFQCIISTDTEVKTGNITIGRLTKGTTATVISGNDNWWQIEYSASLNGKKYSVGWIRKTHVSMVK